ncbi:nicotinate-nucleotide adenylyltransferase [Pararhodospirillum photometricum]|uniref:Probable nicotinate-nucleotide adenylyltransferase n=1 Tax=Pararhodospirillum photometricum DSM 122 TaxID=1150469 RepID=H6SKK5_PARPM|nr:nicotinate-nucleotide adenylyltransferase [Pararhodospirillum photometricum]CCG08520.1 Cytidylyltransferase [Pararhodospirillum photometricum DSM 122]
MPAVTSRTPSPWGDRRRLRVGLLGGSFNPAHAGHRHISEEALARLRLDAVWWLVSPHNPLKPRGSLAPFAARLASAQACVGRDPRLVPLGVEQRWGVVRTYDTLVRLGQRFPRVTFIWLMGADNLAQFPRWHRWLDIVRRVPIAVFDRAPYSSRALAGRAAHRLAPWRRPARAATRLSRAPAWVFLPIRRHGASATAIRARVPGWTAGSRDHPPGSCPPHSLSLKE